MNKETFAIITAVLILIIFLLIVEINKKSSQYDSILKDLGNKYINIK